MSTDLTLCASRHNCPRFKECARALPDGPVKPRQSVADYFKQWGNVCPHYGRGDT